jgi:hypothetical protein
MTPDKKRRVATAGIFLSGVLACLDALKDLQDFWPPDLVCKALRNPQRLKFGVGVTLMVVSLFASVLQQRVR